MAGFFCPFECDVKSCQSCPADNCSVLVLNLSQGFYLFFFSSITVSNPPPCLRNRDPLPSPTAKCTHASPNSYISRFFSFLMFDFFYYSPASGLPRIDASPQIHVSAKVCAVDVTGDQSVTRRSGKVFCMWCRGSELT